jgi:hypothetical protein
MISAAVMNHRTSVGQIAIKLRDHNALRLRLSVGRQWPASIPRGPCHHRRTRPADSVFKDRLRVPSPLKGKTRTRK